VVLTLVLAVAAQAGEDRNALTAYAGRNGSIAVMPRLIRVEGQLGYDDGRGPRIPEYGTWGGPFVQTGDHWYGLDFGKNKELQETAKRLYGKTVVVEGIPEVRPVPGLIPHNIDVIVVTRLSAASEWHHKTVHVEGKLTKQQLFSPTDRYLGVQWELTADGKTYVLDLPHNEQLWNQAEALAGKRVVVTGYFGKDGQLVVTSLTDIIIFEPVPVPVELAR
jgi:hypothetical protein